MDFNGMKTIFNGFVGLTSLATITLGDINDFLAIFVALATITYMITMIIRNIKRM